jgi:hypothetical protein
MANTYTLISSVTVGSGGASSMDFTSIPQTFTDLEILVSGRTTGAGNGINITFNSNTSGYTNTGFQGNGTNTSYYGTYNRNAGMFGYSGDTANSFGSTKIYITNYTNSINKSYLVDAVSENNAVEAYMNIVSGLWSNTSAITSISLSPMAGTLIQYSTAYLYGISNA